MDRFHARTLRQARQRRLAALVAALGLALGITVGTTFAQAGGTGAAADGVVPASPPAQAAAADPAAPYWAEAAVAEAEPFSLFPLLAKVSLGLGFVVLLAWGTVYLLRRSALGQGLSSPGSAVRVIDRNWLGPKKAIYLVDIAGRTLALGVTEESISVLSCWEDGQIQIAPRSQGPGAFATQFRALLSRGRQAAGGGAAT